MGNNRNNIETPLGRVVEHLAEIHIRYQHIIILRASYICMVHRKYSVLFKLLLHISKKNLTKMHKVVKLGRKVYLDLET